MIVFHGALCMHALGIKIIGRIIGHRSNVRWLGIDEKFFTSFERSAELVIVRGVFPTRQNEIQREYLSSCQFKFKNTLDVASCRSSIFI